MSLFEKLFHIVLLLRSKETVKLGAERSHFQEYLNFSNVLSFHLRVYPANDAI